MAYSRSIKTLEAMLPSLEMLRRQESCTWIVPKGTAFKFAYRVREALSIARANADAYPELAAASILFQINVVHDSKVEAIRSEKAAVILAEGLPEPESEPEDIESQDTTILPASYPAPSFNIPAAAVKIHGCKTLYQIVEAIIAHDQSTLPLVFFDVRIDANDQAKLENLMRSKGFVISRDADILLVEPIKLQN